MDRNSPYHLAQRAIADLKAAVHATLAAAGPQGATNAEVGRALGIYAGHVGHQGHISRTILAMMDAEGVAEQDPRTKRWSLRQAPADSAEGEDLT